MRAPLAVLAVALGACSGNATERSPCFKVCEKLNSCRRSTGEGPIPCSACTYGGELLPGLAPTPGCTDLVAAQQACVEAAVQKSCDEYLSAVVACPLCPVLDGSGCASDRDCQKYLPDYRCDLARKGGYCTRACGSADDCSPVGPETCANAQRVPSFDPSAPPTRQWCLLTCKSDAECRMAEGYSCLHPQASASFGICDVP